MGFEKSDKDPYESLVFAKDEKGDKKLVPKSQIDSKSEDDRYEIDHEEDEEKPKGMSRRTFLKGLGAGATVYALSKTDFFNGLDVEAVKEKLSHVTDDIEDYIENFSSNHTLIEQLLKNGEIIDLANGIEKVKENHFTYLTRTEKGREDMRRATQNLSELDLEKFTKPFTDLELPPQLCYMIAIQETRARNLTSWSGARGHMGIMPSTAKAYGYKPEDARNPYIASKIAAQYCSDERERFGNQGDMILHAYNGGGGLFGFTEQTPKKERTRDNFYRHMEAHMNKKLHEYERTGYIPITVRIKDTLYELSRKFGVPLSDVLALNGLTEQSTIYEGQKLKMPFEKNEPTLEIIFRKELEVLRYTPEVKAKYEALETHGFLVQIESELDATSHLG